MDEKDTARCVSRASEEIDQAVTSLKSVEFGTCPSGHGVAAEFVVFDLEPAVGEV